MYNVLIRRKNGQKLNMADNDDLLQELQRLNNNVQQALRASGGNADAPDVKKAKKALDDYAVSMMRGTKATKDNTASTKDATTASGAMAQGLGKVTSGTVAYAAKLAAAASDMRENRENFTSLNSSIELTGNAVSMIGKTAGMAVDAIGDMAGSIPVVGSVIGGAISGIGKLTAAMAEAAGNIISTVGPMLTAELERASEAYRAAGAVGALGAEGMSGLGRQAVQAGLSFSTFSKVAAEGAEGLTFAFGDSATGVKRFADASQAMQPFRRGLLALGVSAEQQNELTTKYIALQARQGNIEGRSARDLAQGSKNYITQLTALSRLTGKSVDEQQKAMDEQMRNVRMAAAVADVQSRLGEDAATAMKNTTAAITSMAPNIGKGLQDALSGNLGTQAAQEFQLAAGEMGAQAVDMLRNGKISQEEATAMIQEGVKRQAAAIGGPQTIGAVAGLGTAFDNVLGDMLAMGQRTTLTAEQIKGLGTAQENLKTTTDGTTSAMINANESMLKSAQALDALALQTTLPLAAKGIEVFTEGMMKATEYMLSFSGMSAEEIAAKLETDATKAATGKDEIDWSKAAGDAITMGLGGAALGAAFGGPIGAAVGLALGTAFGGLTSIFGGERAVGGPVEAGKLYKIGERGVEAFVPNMSGTILPNDQLSQMSDAANTRSNMVMPNDQLSQMLDAAMPKDGMVMPNDQLTKMSNIAGPANSYNSADYGSAVSANLPEKTQTAEQPTENTAGSSNNALMEASINRLDQLVSAMSRNNDINTKILQAANR
jgi:hypothetical protein